MSFELIFTSAPKGLKPGSRGFSSVAFTQGMPLNHVQLCESLSGYVHVFSLQDARYNLNPVVHSHIVATVGDRTFSLLSRIAAYEADYTGRTNKLAHHLMLEPEERTSGGPARLMEQAGVFEERWEGAPRFLPPNRVHLPDPPISSFKAKAWEAAIGDAGCAGRLAQAFLDEPTKPAFIIFEPGMKILPLLAEAQALLPASRRWALTFSTYFTTLPPGLECAWRCCLPDSQALKVARRTAGALVIDLVTRTITGPQPAETDLIECARSGLAPIVKLKKPVERIVVSVPASSPPKRPITTPHHAPPYEPQPAPIQKSQISKELIFGAAVAILILALAALAGLMLSSKIMKERNKTAKADEAEPLTVIEEKQGEKPEAAVLEDFAQPELQLSEFDEDNQKSRATTEEEPNGEESGSETPDNTAPASKTADQGPSPSEEADSQEEKPQAIAEPSVKKSVLKLPDKIEWPKNADPVISFYGTNGTVLKHSENKCYPSPGDIQYQDEKKQTLARKSSTQLDSFYRSIQMIEIIFNNSASAVTNTLYIKEAFDAQTLSCFLEKQNQEHYKLALPLTNDCVKKLVEYITPNRDKLTATNEAGAKCELTDFPSINNQVSFTFVFHAPQQQEDSPASPKPSLSPELQKEKEGLEEAYEKITNAIAKLDAAATNITGSSMLELNKKLNVADAAAEKAEQKDKKLKEAELAKAQKDKDDGEKLSVSLYNASRHALELVWTNTSITRSEQYKQWENKLPHALQLKTKATNSPVGDLVNKVCEYRTEALLSSFGEWLLALATNVIQWRIEEIEKLSTKGQPSSDSSISRVAIICNDVPIIKACTQQK